MAVNLAREGKDKLNFRERTMQVRPIEKRSGMFRAGMPEPRMQ